MKRTTLVVVLATLFAAIILAPVFAGGNREQGSQEPEVQRVLVTGRVTGVTEIDGDRTDVVIATDAGPEVTVEIPTRMARSLRITAGDRFVSEERVLARPGERARILEFTIERGR